MVRHHRLRIHFGFYKNALHLLFSGVLPFLMSIVSITNLAGCIRESQEMGKFEIAHPSPIFQDITRIAFLYTSPGGQVSIHFSTLESHHRNPEGDEFLFSSYETASQVLKSQVVKGAPEARAYSYSKNLNRYVLGTSIDPQIFLYDPDRLTLERVFEGPKSNAFIHRLAVKDDYVYTILSTPSAPIRGFNGILKVHLQTGKHQVIPFSDKMEQGWGGVQTVDPTGRIWFYRAFPMRMMWYDAVRGMRNRTLAGYEGWTVESWDSWRGEDYLVLTNSRGEFIKKRVDLQTMTEQEGGSEFATEQDRLFLESVRVDLYHNDPFAEPLYFRPGSASFYQRSAGQDLFSSVGSIDLGKFEVMGFHLTPQEGATRWIHPQLGELEVLGISPAGDLLVWLRGRKSYAVAEIQSGKLTPHEINLSNLSPADITSLVVTDDGSLYGGGILTFSHLFRFDLPTNRTALLKGAIPDAEGQVNSMFLGLDGKVYGAGYPDSVLFRFDPSAPWNPGNTATHNPTHLGAMGHHRQTRAQKGIQDLDGTIWYQSVTDYAFPIAHALAKADFEKRTLTVKTDLDDGFPEVEALAVFDSEHLVLLGRKNGKPGLYRLNQREFRIEEEKVLAESGGILVNLDPYDRSNSRLFLTQGRKLYGINPDLSIRFIHKSLREISAVVPGEGQDILLIGKTHIERINLTSGAKDIWWNRGDKPGHYIFKHLSWTPVIFHKGLLYIADEEKLWRFNPPRS